MTSLAELSSNLRRLPTVVAQKVAQESAEQISKLAKASFDESQTPYGVPWAPGERGQRVTLRKTGKLEGFLRYIAIGTKLRVALGVPYAKYQIGKRPVFPHRGGALPASYVETLKRVAVRVVRRELGL